MGYKLKRILIYPDGVTEKQVYPNVPEIPYLCFSAEQASSTVKLNKNGTPTAVTLETSIDGNTRTTYTIGDTITLSNIGDKVYFRNTSTTTTGFSTGTSAYYQFAMTGSISASGDVTFLINKNGAKTLSNYCFLDLFFGCSSLTSSPRIPVTSLGDKCCYLMFYQCSNLESLPLLSAKTLKTDCYKSMFAYCSKIKLSTTQTGEYQTPYRIPTEGTGTAGSESLNAMFAQTGGTFKGTPTINTTYYTSNTVV